jgi:hypothetical protein
VMDDIAQVFDRQLKNVAHHSERRLNLMRVGARTAVAAKRLQVELDRYELVDQGAKARVIRRVAGFFWWFWHDPGLRNTAGR